MLHAVIMAGGAGTRFWPVSRTDLPKQLLNLVGDQTMIQATVSRLGSLVSPEDVLIVTNRRLEDQLARQLPQLPSSAILGEPCKRDTAPCIGLAAVLIARRDPEAIMVVMPADHVIPTDDAFRSAVQQAVRVVQQHPQRLVTFGIRPSYPAEIFGYIQRGSLLEGDAKAVGKLYTVKRFREKPHLEVARQYVESGDYYWNSGIFVWRAQTIRSALERLEPEMSTHLNAIAEAIDTPQFPEVLEREFTAIQGKSIDYAVMEHYDDVVVIEAPFQWDDVGSWRALARLRGADGDGNTVIGKHLGVRTQNTIVRGSDDHLIVTLGVQNCIVVHTPDATLVANLEDEEAIREVVRLLDQRGWKEYL